MFEEGYYAITTFSGHSGIGGVGRIGGGVVKDLSRNRSAIMPENRFQNSIEE
jgi:hypothetical protein